MTLRAKCLLAAGLSLLLIGCGSSPPTQFYTLDAVPPRQTPIVRAADAKVQVAAVHIPGALDRQEMVRESAPGKLDVSDQNRWGAPFGEMTRRVLTQDLVQRLGPAAVILPDEPAPQADKIVVDILQFGSGPSGLVTFDGSCSLMRGGSDTPLATFHVHLSENAQPDNYRSDAAAMSHILGELADEIAAAVTRNPPAPRRG
jgi:uncharacterized protein